MIDKQTEAKTDLRIRAPRCSNGSSHGSPLPASLGRCEPPVRQRAAFRRLERGRQSLNELALF